MGTPPSTSSSESSEFGGLWHLLPILLLVLVLVYAPTMWRMEPPETTMETTQESQGPSHMIDIQVLMLVVLGRVVVLQETGIGPLEIFRVISLHS